MNKIDFLKIKIQSWIDGLEISRSVADTEMDAKDIDDQTEILKAVVAVLERIEVVE